MLMLYIKSFFSLKIDRFYLSMMTEMDLNYVSNNQSPKVAALILM